MCTARKLSVVVSFHDEAANVPAVCDEIAELGRCVPLHEVILVDNGSRDDTGDLLEKAAARGWCRVLHNQAPSAYGTGYFSGCAAATGDLIVTNHADGQFRFQEITAGHWLDRMDAQGVGAVFPRRTGRSRLARARSLTVRIGSAIMLGEPVPDVNGQPKIFPRSLVDPGVPGPEGFAFDLHLYRSATRAGLHILRPPTVEHPRRDGASSWSGSVDRQAAALARYLADVRKMQ
jgi:polyisoprenyl-phosphate glycosyltransferase